MTLYLLARDEWRALERLCDGPATSAEIGRALFPGRPPRSASQTARQMCHELRLLGLTTWMRHVLPARWAITGEGLSALHRREEAEC